MFFLHSLYGIDLCEILQVRRRANVHITSYVFLPSFHETWSKRVCFHFLRRAISLVTVYSPFWSTSLLRLRKLFKSMAQAVVLITVTYDLALVSALVGLQLTKLCKSLTAYLTGVRFLAGVQANMLIKLTCLSKCLSTFIALVRFFSYRKKKSSSLLWINEHIQVAKNLNH